MFAGEDRERNDGRDVCRGVELRDLRAYVREDLKVGPGDEGSERCEAQKKHMCIVDGHT